MYVQDMFMDGRIHVSSFPFPLPTYPSRPLTFSDNDNGRYVILPYPAIRPPNFCMKEECEKDLVQRRMRMPKTSFASTCVSLFYKPALHSPSSFSSRSLARSSSLSSLSPFTPPCMFYRNFSFLISLHQLANRPSIDSKHEPR